MKTETKPKPKRKPKDGNPEIIRFKIGGRDEGLIMEASPVLFKSPHIGIMLVRSAQRILDNLATEIAKDAAQ